MNSIGGAVPLNKTQQTRLIYQRKLKMVKTPVWNSVLIYGGIFFSFLFLLVIINILTPNIEEWKEEIQNFDYSFYNETLISEVINST